MENIILSLDDRKEIDGTIHLTAGVFGLAHAIEEVRKSNKLIQPKFK
ncbi:TPA: hypothetical protein ACX96Z_000125 [Clostridium sporogenes]